MTIRKDSRSSHSSSSKKGNSIGRKVSVATKRTWDKIMDNTGIRKMMKKLDALEDWEEPMTLDEALAQDVISTIPFVGIPRAIEQVTQNDQGKAISIVDGALEIVTISGKTFAGLFPSNTIIFFKEKHLPDDAKKMVKWI